MPKLERWGGLVALLSGILGVLYFPFDSAALFKRFGYTAPAEEDW